MINKYIKEERNYSTSNTSYNLYNDVIFNIENVVPKETDDNFPNKNSAFIINTQFMEPCQYLITTRRRK